MCRKKKSGRAKRGFAPEDLSNFAPIPVKKLNGRLICTYGHTRAWVAYAAGLDRVPLVWEEEDLDWELYQICVDACEKRGVHAVAGFQGRILPASDYAEKWDRWCDCMHAEIEAKRREK